MTMTKKHYDAVAHVINVALDEAIHAHGESAPGPTEVLCKLIGRITLTLTQLDPKFDDVRFFSQALKLNVIEVAEIKRGPIAQAVIWQTNDPYDPPFTHYSCYMRCGDKLTEACKASARAECNDTTSIIRVERFNQNGDQP